MIMQMKLRMTRREGITIQSDGYIYIYVKKQ